MLKKKGGGKRASDLTGKEMKNTSISPKDRDERKEYPGGKKGGQGKSTAQYSCNIGEVWWLC